jgi:hypothetical protein
MSETELKEQNDGLRRRIKVLEAQKKQLLETVQFVDQTIRLCQDKTANPLAVMCDKARAEEMIAAALKIDHPTTTENPNDPD